jgi:transposase-like protein
MRETDFMDTSTPFKWRHFQAEVVLLCVRWYLRYPLSYRDLEEMMLVSLMSYESFTLLTKISLVFCIIG